MTKLRLERSRAFRNGAIQLHGMRSISFGHSGANWITGLKTLDHTLPIAVDAESALSTASPEALAADD